MTETINIDFIGVVSITNNGVLEYRRLPITKLFDKEMQILEAMFDNDNRTVMDLQDYFKRFMPKGPDSYNYCAPYKYQSSFIYSAKYPKVYTFTEYHDLLKNGENDVTINFLSDCKLKAVSELTSEQMKFLNKNILKRKQLIQTGRKIEFMRMVRRYVQAHRFYSFLKGIKNDNRNKMYSTENIGWTTFNYPISNDIHFIMKSNFGFGSSSFHFINLTYKGIDILPYSAIVQYYYVNTIEFYRYTRQYRPSRENWEVALEFVVETANLALQDETRFISKWIGNEIDEMIAGLKIISSKPKEKLKDFFKTPKKETNFLFVRHAYKSDKDEYLAYPEEIATIFKAEKLTAALDLLDKLTALSQAYPKALNAIEQIKTLNIDFFPNLKKHIGNIKKEIKCREAILKLKIEERNNLKAKWKLDYNTLYKLIENAQKEGNYESQSIRDQYFSDHTDFKTIYDDVEKRTEDIVQDEYQISKREDFVKKLEFCKNLIIKHLDIAA